MYIEGIFSNHFNCIWIPKLAGWRVWVEVPFGQWLWQELFQAILTRVLQKTWTKLKQSLFVYMGVSKNRGTPKWMVYNGKPY